MKEPLRTAIVFCTKATLRYVLLLMDEKQIPKSKPPDQIKDPKLVSTLDWDQP